MDTDEGEGGPVLLQSLKRRGREGEKLYYQAGTQNPYTGWGKQETPHWEGLCFLEDGKEEGRWTLWYKNGQKAYEGHYKDGREQGLYTSWHKNGQKALVRNHKDGKAAGLWTTWHENGQRVWERRYKDGKRDGLWTEWDEDGKVVKQIRYKDGEEVKE